MAQTETRDNQRSPVHQNLMAFQAQVYYRYSKLGQGQVPYYHGNISSGWALATPVMLFNSNCLQITKCIFGLTLVTNDLDERVSLHWRSRVREQGLDLPWRAQWMQISSTKLNSCTEQENVLWVKGQTVEGESS